MSKANILYVDDEESNLRTFKNSLRREYNVLTARSGKEGLEILAKNDIDVIIADQKMPEMTGVDFLKKALEKNPMPNRILLTGYTDFEAIKDAINKGKIFQYVQKPWEKEILKNIIDKAIEAYFLEKNNKVLKEELIKKNAKISKINIKLKEEIKLKNITLQELKKSQEELQQNEDRLKEAQARAHLGNWEINLKTNQMLWSDEIFRIFQLNPVKTKPSFEAFINIIHPDDKDKATEAYSQHLKDKRSYEIEIRIKVKDKTIKYISHKCHSEFDKKGKAVKSAGIIQDITEKKLAEIELRKYHEHLEDIVKERTAELKAERDRTQNYLDIAAVIFLILDKDQNITLINKKGAETLGYNNEKDLIGFNWYDNFVPNKEINERRQKYVKMFNAKIPFKTEEESIIVTKNDEHKLIAWNNVILKDNEGQTVGVLSSGEDITIRRRNEQILAERKDELEMFNKSMLGREMRTIELKEEINILAKETGRQIPYPEIWNK